MCALLNNLGHLLASLLLGLLNLLLLLLSVAGFYAYFSIAKMLSLYGGGAPNQCVVAEQVLIGADQVSTFAGRMYDEPAGVCRSHVPDQVPLPYSSRPHSLVPPSLWCAQ